MDKYYLSDNIVLKENKTYYQDRDLLPTENFMISITLFPLTTYETNFDGIQ